MQDQHYVYRARERFFAKLAPPDENGCRLWTGKVRRYSKCGVHKGASAYGVMWFHGKEMHTHVFCARYVLNLDTAGLEVSHLCHHKRCCEPTHLVVETRQQNVDRSVEAGHYTGPHNPHRRPGMLSKAAVREILGLCSPRVYHGVNTDMARKYGVSRSLISRIVALGDEYNPHN